LGNSNKILISFNLGPPYLWISIPFLFVVPNIFDVPPRSDFSPRREEGYHEELGSWGVGSSVGFYYGFCGEEVDL
jgi:hypothetical protein